MSSSVPVVALTPPANTAPPPVVVGAPLPATVKLVMFFPLPAVEQVPDGYLSAG